MEKNSVLIVGTVAYDSIETPYGRRERVMGGSAVYASLSARLFSKVYLFSTVGEDYKEEDLNTLRKASIDVSYIKKIKGEKTFFWEGSYLENLNEAVTKKTELNSLLKFETKCDRKLNDVEALFLANIDPELQIKIVNQLKDVKLKCFDTMNYWIETKKEKVFELLTSTDLIFLNEMEMKLLLEEKNVYKGIEKLMKLGAKGVVLKRGEYGSILFFDEKMFILPSYPLKDVVDPTGAGDSFAGAFIGFLTKEGDYSFPKMKEALIFATLLASFTVSGFSVECLIKLNFEDILKRKNEFLSLLV